MIDVTVVSDFNAELATRYLSADERSPVCRTVSAPFGQVFPILEHDSGARDGVLFVWTRPEGVMPEWQRHLDGERVAVHELEAEVDRFASAVANAAQRARLVLVASWLPARLDRGLGLLDWTVDGTARRLAQMNLRLAERLAGMRGVFLLDAQRWIASAAPAWDAKLWYSAKAPFTQAVYRAAADDVKAAIRSAFGGARKLLLLDLDDTLWGGVIGEDGWQTLRLGGHDAVGEAYADFQRALVSLSRRGVTLGIVSKNDEATALEAIDSHPEMVVRRDRLAGWRINWADKAHNVEELARELNVGLDAVVFIDDSPIERGRVREALPDVLVPDWPLDPVRFAEALRQLDCFDQPTMTTEDRARAEMYTADRARRGSSTAYASLEDWLRSLDIRVDLAPIAPNNLKRVTQLLNKTNQMNLRTRRVTEDELKRWLEAEPSRGSWTLTIRDRFGDLGLTGVTTWEAVGGDLEVVDWVLSCRAMGRHAESLMLALLVEHARTQQLGRVAAPLVPTDRNRPCLDFWRASGCLERPPLRFVWDAAVPYPRPDLIHVVEPLPLADAQARRHVKLGPRTE